MFTNLLLRTIVMRLYLKESSTMRKLQQDLNNTSRELQIVCKDVRLDSEVMILYLTCATTLVHSNYSPNFISLCNQIF